MKPLVFPYVGYSLGTSDSANKLNAPCVISYLCPAFWLVNKDDDHGERLRLEAFNH